MPKNFKPLFLLFFFMIMMNAPLLAQEAELSDQRASLFKLSLIIGAAVITLAAAAGIFGQAKAISSACEGISRNPNSGPHIRFLLIFGLVLIETLVIYALLISIIILMVKWGQYV
ncbi:MAG TPA: ATP synthase F0 subunit C [Acidobacteriota bacterium]|nr:ATP synthase F0 subunit C [Acidobacteriota bacterium]